MESTLWKTITKRDGAELPPNIRVSDILYPEVNHFPGNSAPISSGERVEIAIDKI